MKDYEPYYTEDGSIGLYSYADKDVYHSKFGALTEAWEKFVIPSDINTIIDKKNSLNVLDICYGIGYNTKALMSFIINENSKYLKQKNIFEKAFDIVSIYINKIKFRTNKLLRRNASIDSDNSLVKREKILPNIKIDCIDINDELIKLSPFFITLKTPGEVYSDIIPEFWSCFDSYYKFKNIFVNILSKFYPHNKNKITELLDLKFKNMHIKKEYKVNRIVNYILLNRMYEIYGRNYLDKNLVNILKDKYTRRFFDKSYIKYAKFNHKWGYNSSSLNILSSFLHNIYYSHISKRNKFVNFKKAQRMFKLTFHSDDARKVVCSPKIKYDCIYLDAFTYTKAPQLWSLEFIRKLYDCIDEDGVLLTYSNSVQIRNTLMENNFYVGKIYNKDTNKFIGTIASKNKDKIEYPLSNYEIGLCKTKAGIPYRDNHLSLTVQEILENREYEFNNSSLMSSSRYMKLRTLRGDNDKS